MSLLVISPDYASHLLPLASLAAAWAERGERVVVATGESTAAIVAGFGFTRVDLRLGRGSNPGVIRTQEQVRAEGESLRGFFAATRRGLVPTLAYQARERRTDLLWEPLATARAVLDVVERVGADAVLVDHLAFTARLALRVAGVPHADVVLGHPSALPVAGEVYGYPSAWPRGIAAPPHEEMAELRALCEDVAAAFTGEWNAAATALDAGAAAVDDAFAVAGDLLLLNYPQALHDASRTAALPPHAFLGSAVRAEAAPPDVAAWLDAQRGRPIVYVSFGSFLSARGDVLGVVARALAGLDVAVALATGTARPADLGDLPAHWLVREHLPQVAIVARADVVVCHGGNNSVTEALTAGVPLLVLPFSTEQPAGAAAVEAAGVATVADPNVTSAREVADAVRELLAGPARQRAAEIGAELRDRPGRERAYAALAQAALTRQP